MIQTRWTRAQRLSMPLARHVVRDLAVGARRLYSTPFS